MTDEQMYKVKDRTEWNEEKRKWKLPPFIIKQKEVQFPKLGNANQFIQDELDQNEVTFATGNEGVNGGSNSLQTHFQNQSSSQSNTQRKNNHYGRIESSASKQRRDLS